jgi:hypothetical protein
MTNRRFFVAGLFACAALGVMAWVTIRSAGVDPDELLKMVVPLCVVAADDVPRWNLEANA